MKQNVPLLAPGLSKCALLVGPHCKARDSDLKRTIPLSHDQCAYYKEKGHWKNECPRRPEKKTKVVSPQSQYQPEQPSTNMIRLAQAESN